MITADRFIETSENYEAWLAARRPAVTATEVAKASTPAGFADAVSARREMATVVANEVMRFGSDHEDWIARALKADHWLMPNRWLIAAADNPLHMATPDCLSLDHTTIGEIKTSGKQITRPPLAHVRQVQWQLRCTGADRCVYAFMLRVEVNGVLAPAWLEPQTWVIERDPKMIADLTATADRLLATDNEWSTAA
jgi:hypothetical protein